MTKKYVIEAKNTTLHGSLNNEYKLILTIRSNDSVQDSTIDIGWGYNGKDGRESLGSSNNWANCD